MKVENTSTGSDKSNLVESYCIFFVTQWFFFFFPLLLPPFSVSTTIPNISLVIKRSCYEGGEKGERYKRF